MNFRTRFLLLAILWLSFSTFLFCLPGKAIPEVGWMSQLGIDKWVHAFIFLLLFCLWYYALGLHAWKQAAWLIAALVLYGTAVEMVQHHLIVNRSYDVFDILADSAGAVLGLVWVRYIKK